MDSPACFGARERRPMNQFGLTHMAFYVDDIDAVAADVLANGGRTYPQTRAVFGSGIEIMYCTDPDGVRVELMKAA
jgi:predicted enzyme related to lactoylglutathione lyase